MNNFFTDVNDQMLQDGVLSIIKSIILNVDDYREVN